MTEIKLRPYQRDAIDAVFKAWADGMKRPAIVLPTGAGKTVVFSSLVREWLHDTQYTRTTQGRRVIILAHRDELVDQAIDKLRAIAPGLNVGKVKAQDRQTAADVMVCSVQTLSRDKALQEMLDWEADVGKVGVIITDEGHHAAAASYRKIYAAFPDALQLGVTATMIRGDGVGLGGVWEDVVYQKSILWMISKGYLCDVRTKQVDLKALDMASVGVSRGDWAAGDLGRALMESEADTAIARAYREHAGDRQGIVFTPTVETAYAAADALNAAYITAVPISGESTREERQLAYEQYRRGRVRVLVTCMVLTEGFDAPWAEVAVIARPTRSAGLYTQMVGRVLRPWPGKKEALVIDLVGASANKLRTLVDLAHGTIETVRDDESLAEAVVREAKEGNAKVPAGSIAFELWAREVDSFGASSAAWIRTPAGVMFLNCGDTRVFLWPVKEASGLWNVCVATKGKAWQVTEYTGLAIGEAMAWGEAVAEDYSSFSTQRSARWRRNKPSQTQLDYADMLGISGTEGMSRGQLSAAIDLQVGSDIFDPHVGRA